jgi:hypothetical protein
MKYRIVNRNNLFYPQYNLLWIWWDYNQIIPSHDFFYTNPIAFENEIDARSFLSSKADAMSIPVIKK